MARPASRARDWRGGARPGPVRRLCRASAGTGREPLDRHAGYGRFLRLARQHGLASGFDLDNARDAFNAGHQCRLDSTASACARSPGASAGVAGACGSGGGKTDRRRSIEFGSAGRCASVAGSVRCERRASGGRCFGIPPVRLGACYRGRRQRSSPGAASRAAARSIGDDRSRSGGVSIAVGWWHVRPGAVQLAGPRSSA